MNDKVYTLEFDGTNLVVKFLESGITSNDNENEKNPVEIVQTEASKMIKNIFEISKITEMTVKVGEGSVSLTKENQNVKELAKLFLDNTDVNGFIQNGKVNKKFTATIKKDDITVELDEITGQFEMIMDMDQAK